jgi:predicted metal-dependent HD superfamily phosphohydrolase
MGEMELAASRDRWLNLLLPLGAAGAAAGRAFDDVARHYRSPGRHYHTLSHVVTVLDTIDRLCGPGAAPPALLLAAWLHDVVYDPRAADNEERSADYARALRGPLGLDGTLVEETARLILLTRTHQAAADDAAGKVLLDADLAVLGAAPVEYDCYAAAIRREYAWVPDAAYRRGRTAVLERFLSRLRLFQTASLFAEAERQARRNLRRELDSLRG